MFNAGAAATHTHKKEKQWARCLVKSWCHAFPPWRGRALCTCKSSTPTAFLKLFCLYKLLWIRFPLCDAHRI